MIESQLMRVIDPELMVDLVKFIRTWSWSYTALQKHESTYLTPYVCTERIFDSRPFMCNKIFFPVFARYVKHQILYLYLDLLYPLLDNIKSNIDYIAQVWVIRHIEWTWLYRDTQGV